MGSKYMRLSKKEKICDVTVDALIERIKKMRALNCIPSDVGMDNFVWKKLTLNRPDMLTRF